MSTKVIRYVSIVIGIIIIAHGIFSEQIAPLYQGIAEFVIWDDAIRAHLINLLNGPHAAAGDQYNLGEYLLAKPVYFGLHMLLITVLFWNNPKSRRNALLIFIGILCLLLGVILCAYFLEINSAYIISKRMLTNALNLPIILFFVEGGRIINKDIDRLLNNKTQV